MGNAQRCFELLQAGDWDALRRLVEEDTECAAARDGHGVSLLMQTLYRGRRDLAEAVAARKNSLDIFEATALGRLGRLKKLAADRGLANSNSGDGFTALHFACFFGQSQAALELIEAGAAVDAVAANPMKVMPLHSAASARNLEAARHLLEHGAPVNARQEKGWAPLHAAAQNGDRAMAELLLRHGADPRQANDDRKTAAMVAREKGHEDLAGLLERAT
ncbi:MAG TPA: ankyrin repeat domain-containing protein [Terriglobales bacterium]|nr:ankyrin repeat domain-containing protein [Terriglobales bacterium]